MQKYSKKIESVAHSIVGSFLKFSIYFEKLMFYIKIQIVFMAYVVLKSICIFDISFIIVQMKISLASVVSALSFSQTATRIGLRFFRTQVNHRSLTKHFFLTRVMYTNIPSNDTLFLS